MSRAYAKRPSSGSVIGHKVQVSQMPTSCAACFGEVVRHGDIKTDVEAYLNLYVDLVVS